MYRIAWYRGANTSTYLCLLQTQSYSGYSGVSDGAAVESSNRGASPGESVPTWTDSTRRDCPFLHQRLDRRGTLIPGVSLIY